MLGKDVQARYYIGHFIHSGRRKAVSFTDAACPILDRLTGLPKRFQGAFIGLYVPEGALVGIILVMPDNIGSLHLAFGINLSFRWYRKVSGFD